ncbi:hypothetical protein GE061_009691, partial [Apolygus lucorum]
SNEFIIRMSRDTLATLKRHLQEKKQSIILNIIQEHLYFDMYEGVARTKQQIDAVAGSIIGEATRADNKTKVYYGMPKEPDYQYTAVDDDEEGEAGEGDKPKKKKPKKEPLFGKKTKSDPNAPPTDRLPLPDLKDNDKMEKVKALREASKRVTLGPETLPSICCYTLLNAEGKVICSEISDDSSILAVGFSNSNIKLWSLLPQKLKGMKSAEQLQDIDHDAEDVWARIIDERNVDTTRVLYGHSGPVYRLSFSPDRSLLLSCSEDATVRLWSLLTWTCLVAYKGHVYPVWDVRFSPHGYYFATASHDKTARLWTTDHHQPLRIFAGHFSDVDGQSGELWATRGTHSPPSSCQESTKNMISSSQWATLGGDGDPNSPISERSRWTSVFPASEESHQHPLGRLEDTALNMEVYNPQKYCYNCKNPITRFEPNPRFLSCKHLMCDKCFRAKDWGLFVKCNCGVESGLPVAETEVFPKLDDAWNDLLKTEVAKLSSPIGASIVFGSSASSSWEENLPSKDIEKSSGSSNVASAWFQSSSPTVSPLQQVLPPNLTQPSFPVQNVAPFQFPSLRETLRVIDPRTSSITQVLEAEEIISRKAVQPPEKPRNTGAIPVWTQLNNNNIFGRAVSPIVPPPANNGTPWKTLPSTRVQGFSQCQRHSMTSELWCEQCDKLLCGLCVLSVDHPPYHVANLRPHPALTASRIHDVIQVLNDHSQAILGISAIASIFEFGNRHTLLDFTRDLIGKMEANRDALRDYERRSAELTASSNMASFAFDVASDRPSTVFDDYIAVKNALDKMVEDEEVKKAGSGTALLVKVSAMVIYQVFRSALRGVSWGAAVENRKPGKLNAATNTVPISEDLYAVWLGTLSHRSELAKRVTDPNAVIPAGWFVNTLPNVFFIEFSVGQQTLGRVLIETNPDIAPVMSANFALLCNKARYLSYKDCVVFQCWPGQSIITGDNETKCGTGGKSILNDDFVVPDETGLVSFRGAVGMRRLKKRISKAGEISSQFRITLEEMKGITGIFGRVVKGIEIVEEIAKLGDKNGNPKKPIRISDCGKL